MNMEKFLRNALIGGVFVIPFIPLMVTNFLFFPYITGKNFTFRIIVELLFGGWLILALIRPEYRPKFSWILGAALAVLGVMAAATVASENPLKSFWSNFERMEGYITLLHLFAYFVVASVVLTTERLWRTFWNISLGVAFAVGAYAFTQYIGWFPMHQGDRPDSTLGNATYLAGYLMFHLFIAVLLFVRSREELFLRWTYGCLAAFSLFIIYITATRGAAIGVAGGVLIAAFLYVLFERENRKGRKVAIGVIAGVLILAGSMALLRNATFVKESPVLGRLSSISLEAGKSRFLVWNMALQGAQERPIFGWGQESFNFVFNKYYDPRMYDQESWFDRVHDVYLDWLIAGGVLGLIAYLSLYGSALYYTLRRRSVFTGAERAVLGGLLSAYFIYNFFVFDNIANYLLFFSLLAYIHGRNSMERQPIAGKWQVSPGIATRMGAPIIAIGMFSVMYLTNVPGLFAANELVRGLSAQSEGLGKNLEYFKQALARNSFGTQEIREQLVTVANRMTTLQGVDPSLRQEFYTLARTEMQEQIDRVPNDARFDLFMASLFDTYRQYPEAVPYLKKALELSPKKQITLFEAGSNLLNQGNTAEALQAFKTAYELEPKYRDAGLLYAIGLIYSGDMAAANKLLTETYGTLLVFDQRLIQAYARRGEYNKIVAILEKASESSPGDWQVRISLAAGYQALGKRAQAIEELQKAAELNPEIKTQTDFYISELRAGRDPFQ